LAVWGVHSVGPPTYQGSKAASQQVGLSRHRRLGAALSSYFEVLYDPWAST
jgi:hypothetical protein